MVFANNDGLLEFNGSHWKMHRLPEKTICRSLCISNNSKIYVGGQDEVGYFAADKKGNLQYTSIRERIKEKDLPLTDVWDIVSKDGHQYFRSNEKIFVDNNRDSIYAFAAFPTITKFSEIDGVLYLAVQNQGLYKVLGNKLIRCVGTKTANITITSMCSSVDGLLLATLADGIFRYTNDTIQRIDLSYEGFLSESRILQIYHSHQNKIIIGTERNGIIIADESLKAQYHINKVTGLQNNTIHTIHEDQGGSIWVGTANGIDQILIQDGTQVFYPDGEEEGSIYDMLEFEGRYYFATGNGLYSLKKQDLYNPFEKRNFTLVENTLGQVWGLDIVDNKLFMGHLNGAFLIEGGKAIQISPTNSGTWRFNSLGNDLMVAGTYFGFDFYKKENNRFKYLKSSSEFLESSRIIEIDNQRQIWVSHPYRGIYKIKLDSSFNLTIKHYGEAEGLYSDNHNYVFQYQNEIIAASEFGIYQFDQEQNLFYPKKEWLEYLKPKTHVRRLFPLNEHQVIYVTETHIGRFLYSSQIGEPAIFHQSWTKHAEALLNGFEYIYSMDEGTFFLASDKGVIIHNLNTAKTEQVITTHFNDISIVQDKSTSLYAGYGNINNNQKLEPYENTILFSYGSNMMNPSQPTEFRYWLDGVEDNWSSWSINQNKDYTGLRHGKYNFHVQSKNATHGESEIITYSFHIKPYWYQSTFAFLLYSLLSFFGLLIFFRFLKRRFKAEQKLSQEEIELLKNEKLETELQFRNKELASSTMHLVQKNETITKIKQEIDGIYEKVKDPKIRKELRKVITVINDDNRLEDDWENFAIYFDKVHTNFLKRLAKKYPKLSSKDLKLAAYLRMNLTTKEIAPLLNISIRGVEISRYRLRKKLALETSTNLNEYMMNF